MKDGKDSAFDRYLPCPAIFTGSPGTAAVVFPFLSGGITKFLSCKQSKKISTTSVSIVCKKEQTSSEKVSKGSEQTKTFGSFAYSATIPLICERRSSEGGAEKEESCHSNCAWSFPFAPFDQTTADQIDTIPNGRLLPCQLGNWLPFLFADPVLPQHGKGKVPRGQARLLCG